jgi:cytochrome c biogenesis protein CcmG/thiol:disulfide interchange protein DsbE
VCRAAAVYPVAVQQQRRSVVPAVVVVLAAALIGLLIYGVVKGGNDTTLDDAVKRGDLPAAPGMTMARPLLNGDGTAKLADYRGKIVVLNFWASWCDPCAAEAPVLERVHRRLQSAGAGTVLGATYSDAVGDSRAFEREHDVAYPSVRDVATKLARKYGTKNLPETFVIDRRGRIVAISRGQVSQKFLDVALAKAQKS